MSKGKAWLFTAFAAQFRQPVMLKGGNGVFDDLDPRACEPEKLFTQAHLPVASVSSMIHTANALDFLFSVQADNASRLAVLLDIAGFVGPAARAPMPPTDISKR